MAINPGNFLSVKWFFQQDTNQALVTSFWQVVDDPVPNTYSAFAEMMAQMFMSTGRNGFLIHSGSQLKRVIVDNLSIPAEYGEWLGTISGASGGAPTPPFVAVSIKQTVETRITRAGYKRIPFPTESVVDGNALNIAAPDRVAIEDFWSGNVSYTYITLVDGLATYELAPVVIGRTLDPVTGEYFLDMTKINLVTDATAVKPTSQTSRKL